MGVDIMKKLVSLIKSCFTSCQEEIGKKNNNANKKTMAIDERKNIITDRDKIKEDILNKNSLYRAIRVLENREITTYDSKILLDKKIDYEKELSGEQKRALCAIDGQYLVIAGAGSGKTRTIVYRTALLLEMGVDPKNILMITFTKKAALEMKERVESLLGHKLKDLEISTFHSFCGRSIMKHKN